MPVDPARSQAGVDISAVAEAERRERMQAAAARWREEFERKRVPRPPRIETVSRLLIACAIMGVLALIIARGVVWLAQGAPDRRPAAEQVAP
jgi:hypothetical protein